jgi:hypothetical protein
MVTTVSDVAVVVGGPLGLMGLLGSSSEIKIQPYRKGIQGEKVVAGVLLPPVAR